MMMRRLSTIVAALLLSACSVWTGPPFYGRSEAINPFPPGTYRVSGGTDPPLLVHWDGHHLAEAGRTWRAEDQAGLQDWMAVALPVRGRDIYVLQWKVDDDRAGRAVYAILERRGVRYRVNLPDCLTGQAIARESGAEIESVGLANRVPETSFGRAKDQLPLPSSKNCVFRSRESLETALRRYINERQLLGPLMERTGD